MKRLLTLILFLSLVFGQDELIGYWYSGKCKAIIKKEGNKLFISWRDCWYNLRKRLSPDEVYWNSDKTEIYDPWFGNSYYIHELWDHLAGETLTRKVEIVLINRDNIRIDGVLHEKKRLYKP